MAHLSRYKLRDSDRDGMTRREITLVKDGAFKVAGEEYDTPPPSKLSLGGQGDISQGEALVANSFGITEITSTPLAYSNPITYITAAGGITASFAHPWMYVVGSLENINLTADPQITASVEDRQLTLYGVGSSITLEQGSGLVMAASAPMILDSGDLITFMYDTGDSVWIETSRNKGGGL